MTLNQTTTFWTLLKLKAFVDDKLNIAKFFIEIENTAGKGQNAGYKHFLLYPTVFSKVSFGMVPNKPWFFTCLQHKLFENTVGKGEIARNEQFLLFPHCFLPFGKLLAIFINFEIFVCKLFQFGRV